MTRIVYRPARRTVRAPAGALPTSAADAGGREPGARRTADRAPDRRRARAIGCGALSAALVAVLLGGSLRAEPRPGDASSGTVGAMDGGAPAETAGAERNGPPAFRPFLERDVPDDVGAAVAERLAFAAMLEPEGIERPHWRSFDGVGPATAPRTDEAARFVVAIDPGHGGSDPGAKGPNGLLEKHLTLDIARRVRLFLSEIDDVDVILTRERDHGLSRASRVAAVRRSGADLFVSLHFNHLPQSEITLVESFYAGPANIAESRALQRERGEKTATARRTSVATTPDLTFTRGSERFANLVQRRVFDEVERDNAEALDAGVKRDTLFVLTRSFTSGALIELTCLSNAEEAERLTDEGYRDALAAGLADAIREYRISLETSPLDENGA